MGNDINCATPTNSTNSSSSVNGGAISSGGTVEYSTNPGFYTLIGMGLTVLSSFAVALGTVLQKKAHMADLEKPLSERAPRKAGILCAPMWVFGFLIMAFLQIPLSFGALAMAPQSVVIPLGAGTTIVLTQILAVCVLKEAMGRLEGLATAIIVVGIVMTTTANQGGGPEKVLTACGILNRYMETDFLVPIIVLLVSLSGCVVLLQYGHLVKPRYQPVLYAYIAGALGALLNIMLKVVGEFTQGALSGDVQASEGWSSIHPYYHLFAVILMAVGMISFINQGLERFPAVTFLPLYNCLFIILSTLFGALFFREFDTFGPTAVALFTLGVIITVSGIALISCSGGEFKIRGEDDFSGEMEGFGLQMNNSNNNGTGSNGVGGRGRRGPPDPLEPNYFDADLSFDEKQYVETPVLARLVLI
jgi:hypothetical protein